MRRQGQLLPLWIVCLVYGCQRQPTQFLPGQRFVQLGPVLVDVEEGAMQVGILTSDGKSWLKQSDVLESGKEHTILLTFNGPEAGTLVFANAAKKKGDRAKFTISRVTVDKFP